jgi:hypothetical protein
MDVLGGLDVSGQLPEVPVEALLGEMSAAFIDEQIVREAPGDSLSGSGAAGGTDLFDEGRGTRTQGDDAFGMGLADGDPEAEALCLGALHSMDGKVAKFSESHAGESEQQQGVGGDGVGTLKCFLDGAVDLRRERFGQLKG